MVVPIDNQKGPDNELNVLMLSVKVVSSGQSMTIWTISAPLAVTTGTIHSTEIFLPASMKILVILIVTVVALTSALTVNEVSSLSLYVNAIFICSMQSQ